jgi:hypothetical protein
MRRGGRWKKERSRSLRLMLNLLPYRKRKMLLMHHQQKKAKTLNLLNLLHLEMLSQRKLKRRLLLDVKS